MQPPIFINKNTPELREKLKALGLKCNNGKWMGQYLAVFRRRDNNELRYVGSPEYDLKNCPNYSRGIICVSEERFIGFVQEILDTDAKEKENQG